MKRVLTRSRHSDANETSLALAKVAAIQLLERSIQFGHGRLAMLRLAIAVQSGAPIPRDHWNYCHQYASSSRNTETLNLFKETSQAGSCPPEFSLLVTTVPQHDSLFHHFSTKVNHEAP